MLQQRRLGKTGLSVSELALGTWGLASGSYGRVALRDFVRIIGSAWDEGITTFDMAPLWGQGEAESTVGMALAPYRERACLVSRAGRNIRNGQVVSDFEPTALRRDLEASLKRLGTDYLDVWLLHEPREDVFEQEDVLELLSTLKQEGKIRVWGASVSSAAHARAALNAHAEVLCVVHNVLSPMVLPPLKADVERLGVGILVRSALAYGLLAGRWNDAHRFEHDDHRYERWDRDTFRRRIQQVESLRTLLKPPVTSLTALALRYLLADGVVSSVLLGARSLEHVREAVSAIHEPPYLTEPQVQELQEFQSTWGLHDTIPWGLPISRQQMP